MYDTISTNPSLNGRKLIVLSRCSMTLFTFRRHLMHDATSNGAIVIAAAASGDGYEHKITAAGFQFVDIPVSRRSISPLSDLILIWSLVALFRKERPDIIHLFTIKLVIYGLIAAIITKVPCRFATITGLGHVFTTGSGFMRRVVKFLYKFSLRNVTHLWFENTDDRAEFVQSGLLNDISNSIIPGAGVDCEEFLPVSLPHISHQPLSFLMVARLLVEKGVMEYLEAAEAVSRQHPSVRFRLVGGVDARNPSAITADQLARLKASHVVEWIGQVNDVRPEISRADVMVLPSYREGLPVSLMEGAAMGRALLATNVPGCREIVVEGETGYLVAARQSSSLAEGMLWYIDHIDLIPQLGQSARHRMQTRFDRKIVNQMIFEAYARAF